MNDSKDDLQAGIKKGKNPTKMDRMNEEYVKFQEMSI
jgi:hypothetical protein